MQDLKTGEMKPLDVADVARGMAAAMSKVESVKFGEQNNEEASESTAEEILQQAKDAALPRNRQGPVFMVGQVIEIDGGRFRVASIGRKAIMLEGLPGTSLLMAKGKDKGKVAFTKVRPPDDRGSD